MKMIKTFAHRWEKRYNSPLCLSKGMFLSHTNTESPQIGHFYVQKMREEQKKNNLKFLIKNHKKWGRLNALYLADLF